MEGSPKQQTSEIQYPEIVKEINSMFEEDQAMRLRALENNGIIESGEDNNLDKVNTERMKKIVGQIGWLSVSKVGKDVSHQAWLLVQHSDHDVEFQSLCLSLMSELPAVEVDQKDVAHLADRVRINRGQPQLYGTQFREAGDGHIPKDIEDIQNVDERRKQMGLDTLAENIGRINEKYSMG